MKRKIAALFLVIVTLLSVCGLSASADEAAWKARFWVASYDYDAELAYDQSFIVDKTNINNAEGKNVMQFFQYVYGAICEWDDAKGAFVITKSDKWNNKTDWKLPENGFFFMVGIQGQPELDTYEFGEANYEAAQTFVDNAAEGQTIYFYGVDFANRKIDATPWNRTNMSDYTTNAYATLGAPDSAAGEAASMTVSSIGHSSFSYPEASTDGTSDTTTTVAANTTASSNDSGDTTATTTTTAEDKTTTTSRTTVKRDVEATATTTTGNKDDDGMPGWVLPVIIATAVVIIAVIVIVIVASKKKKGKVDAAVKAGKDAENK